MNTIMIPRLKTSTASPIFQRTASVRCLGSHLLFSTDESVRKSNGSTNVSILFHGIHTHSPDPRLFASLLKSNHFQHHYSFFYAKTLRQLSHLAIPRSEDLKKEAKVDGGNETQASTKTKIKSAAQKGSVVVRKGATSLRDILKKYGWTFAGTYFTIWVITLSLVFGSIDSGYVDPVTITDTIHSIWSSVKDLSGISQPSIEPNSSTDILTSQSSISVESGSEESSSARNTVEMLASKLDLWETTRPYASIVRENPHVGNFAVALVITKLTEVVRLPLALAIVPRISRALGQKVEEEDGDDVGNTASESPENKSRG